jgi:glycosyltransferase involved in cell wall biosynthesis
MPLLSIVIPAYNTEPYLAECLDSVIAQGGDNFEIVIVDDCSTDNSGVLADEYAAKYEHVQVLHHGTNLGVSVSRNDGIREAQGDFVLFLDSDDRLFEGAFDALRGTLENEPNTDVVVCSVISQHGEYSNAYMFDGAATTIKDPDAYLLHLNRDNFHPECCWHYAIRRSFLVENGLFFLDVKIAEDQEFVARLLCEMQSFALCPGEFYWYRERDHSLKKSMDIEASLSLIQVADSLCEFSKSRQFSQTRQEFLRLRIQHALSLFSARLIMHEPDEVPLLSKLVGKFERNSDTLVEGFDREHINFSVGSDGFESSLNRYREILAGDLLDKIGQYKFEDLYLYCTGLIGKATARILTSNGIPVTGVLDDNQTLAGQSMGDIDISASDILDRKSTEELEKTLIIVCNQKVMLFERIRKNLKKRYGNSLQIVHNFF